MLVLFDNGTPRTLARYLIDHHAVTEARARGWEELERPWVGRIGKRRTAECGRGRGVRSVGDDGQESSLSAEPCGPQDSHCRVRGRTVEPYQAACSADCRHSERSDTGQLC